MICMQLRVCVTSELFQSVLVHVITALTGEPRKSDVLSHFSLKSLQSGIFYYFFSLEDVETFCGHVFLVFSLFLFESTQWNIVQPSSWKLKQLSSVKNGPQVLFCHNTNFNFQCK